VARPGAEDVEEFLLKLAGGYQAQVAIPSPPPQFPSTTIASPPSTQIASERSVSYKIFGQSKHADNAIDALIDILRTLAGRNSLFLEKLAPIVRGRTRNHLARAREDVYPQKPDLIEYTMQLVPVWWFGTNISNRDKMRIIERACEVEKLVFGKDISISLPNAKG
jgi:hypothetical protein